MTDDAITRLPAATSGTHVRRAVPQPYQRPRISLGDPVIRRVWTMVPAYQLRVDDVIPTVGRLYKVQEEVIMPTVDTGQDPQEIADATTWTVTVLGGNGNVRTYQGGEAVYAFTAAPSPEEAG